MKLSKGNRELQAKTDSLVDECNELRFAGQQEVLVEQV